MSFDFHTLYAGHTNAQLLAIVLQKDLHDELAVQAAEDILKTREVTEEDKTAAEAVALERAQREQQLIEQKAAIANRIREIFFPMGKPITWFLKAFSVGVLLFWLFELLGWLFGLYRRSVYFEPDFFEFPGGWPQVILILSDLYLLIMLFLVFRINRNGWLLAMVYYLIKAGFHLLDVIVNAALYQPAEHPFILVRATITGGILYFFTRKEVRAAFGIPKKEYLGVLISGAVLSLLMILKLHL
jgi:hypothetical protein